MISSKIIGSFRANALTCLVRYNDRTVQRTARHISSSSCYFSAESVPAPSADGQKKVYPAHIEKIAAEISQLTLLDVADLNSLLKERLNIPDAAPMAMMPGMMMGAPKAEEEEDTQAVKEVKTNFNVKLTGFDDSKKLALIKFIKEHMEGFNLVQAKKFVESLPANISTDIGKTEAEKMRDDLIAVGGHAEIE